MEKNLDHYDYIVFQIVWESSRMIDDLGDTERKFIQSIWSKYQLRLVTDKTYRNADQKTRVTQIINSDPGLKSYFTGHPATRMADIHRGVTNLLNDDMRTLTGLPSENIPTKGRPLETAIRIPQAVMGVNGGKKVKKRMQRMVQQDRRQAHEELVEMAPDRPQLSAREEQRIFMERLQVNMDRFQNQIAQAVSVQMEAIEQAHIQNTNTSMDGQRLVERLDKKFDKQMGRLIELSEGGKKWHEIPLKQLPRFFKNKLVAGMKRTGLAAVALPFYTIPKAIISFTIIQPLKVVADDINYMIRWIHRIMGWTLVAVLVAGVWIVMTHEEYDEDRQRFWAYWAQVSGGTVGTIGKKWLVDPATGTVQLLMDNMPGNKFFGLLYDTMKSALTAAVSNVTTWFYNSMGTAISMLHGYLSSAISQGVSGVVSKFKIW
jgi:Ni,Fe-hydrogenase I cytochrome b subunit